MTWIANFVRVVQQPAVAVVIATILAINCEVVRAQAVEEPTIRISPSLIEMGAFYNGGRVSIEGTAPADSQVMVIVRGPATEELFNHKERLGPIWINKDKVHVSGTPTLFLRFSSEDVHSLLDRHLLDQYGLDELSMRHRIHVHVASGDPDPAYRDRLVNNFIELKKSDGTYRRVSDKVHETRRDGVTHYHVDFEWPKSAPPGSYAVEVYAIAPGMVLGQDSTELRLVEVGFPQAVAKLAEQYAWLYGLVAVLAAAAAGFGMDALVSFLKPYRPTPKPVPERAEATPADAFAHEHEDKHVHH